MSFINGHFSAYLKDDPTNIIWEKHNVEVIIGGWLLAWVMASSSLQNSSVGSTPLLLPNYPIWGLAIGNAGADNLPPNSDTQKLQTGLVQEIYRKAASYIYFLDPTSFLSSGGQAKVAVPELSPYVEIQTVFNSSTDLILQTNPTITEMGLVGGTTQMYAGITANPLNMGGNPVNQTGGGILLDYLNPTPFIIPTGRDFIISVLLDFSH